MSAGQVFIAVQDGECGVCGKTIERGTKVRYYDEVLCHAKCVDPDAPETTVLVVRGHDSRPIAVPEDIVLAAERPYRAYMLKQAGHNWETIALAENYPSWKSARADVQRYLDEGSSVIADFTRKQLLELEIARLEQLQQAVWSIAMKGNLPAVNSALSIITTRAKLLRLDQDIRDEDEAMTGRTVVVGTDEDGYRAGLQAASGVTPGRVIDSKESSDG